MKRSTLRNLSTDLLRRRGRSTDPDSKDPKPSKDSIGHGFSGGGGSARCSGRGLDQLPIEVLEKIIAYVIIGHTDPTIWFLYRDLFALSRTCKSIRVLLPNEVLYQTVVLANKPQALAFYRAVKADAKDRDGVGIPGTTPPASPSAHGTASHISAGPGGRIGPTSFVRTVHISRPVESRASNVSLGNAGYSFSSRAVYTKSWPDLILKLVALLPNIDQLVLTQIPKNFSLGSSELEHSKSYQQIQKKSKTRSIAVSLIPESGWTLSLSPQLIWPLGNIHRLYLCNVIITDDTLTRPATSSASILELSGCRMRCDPTRLIQYFGNVTALTLDNLKEDWEITWARCFPKLESLTLGLVGRVSRVDDQKMPVGLLPPGYSATPPKPENDANETISLSNAAQILELELSRIPKLSCLTVYAPVACVIPRDRPQYRREDDIFAHISQLHHLTTLNAVIVCSEESKAAIWRTKDHWTSFLTKRSIPDHVDFTVRSYYDERVLHERPPQ